MKIAVGIATFNRLNYLQITAHSLANCVGVADCAVRLYDDCSNEYGLDTLQKLFPDARTIVRREANLGADRNMYQMYKDFLNTPDDVLLTLDSDMLMRTECFDVIRQVLPHTDGILGLYNSAMHPAGKQLAVGDMQCVEKEHVGAAAVAMTRDIVAKIVENVLPGKSYDWRWSQYLRDQKLRIIVTHDSYVQHIGLHGFNCDGGRSVDFGLNFYPDQAADQKIAVDFLQELLIAKDSHIEYLYRSIAYNLGNIFVLPVRGLYRAFCRMAGKGA